ncbi:HAD family hydrolase [Nocardioides sediminis]|uniref:HAD family hydrolase n=1 Tax=Nocardioides sediminis TaxID=433648 RepID=UPI000D301B59|nr:HAD family hydrolase [Nocardioides sediminis]
MDELLPSWRPGATRDALVGFLDGVTDRPVDERVACFDNDGTLWCERPTYVQLDFLVDRLTAAVAEDPTLGDQPELAAVLSGDTAAIGEMGLERVGMALTGLCRGWSPEEFTASVRDFMSRAQHPTLGRPHRTAVYQPMLELLDALREREVTVTIVTGGGTEFVRAISADLYGVPPECVVGTMLAYDYDRDDHGRPRLRRTATLSGGANEGAAKVGAIQAQLGRRPVMAAGNSVGDREMLEWAAGGDGPRLSLLVDHDDAVREFAYASSAGTFTEQEPIVDVARRAGWTTVSMARDWDAVFAVFAP